GGRRQWGRAETGGFAKVNFDPGRDGTAFEQCLENSERVILATVGAHNNGLPTIAVLASTEVPRADLPVAIGCLSHHLADIGDDRRKDGRIVKEVLPSEPLGALVDILQAVNAAIQDLSVQLQLGCDLLGQLPNRINEGAPAGKARPKRVLRLAPGPLFHTCQELTELLG